MPKKNQTFQDVLAQLTNANTAMVDETNAKVITRKKTDITNIMSDVFEIDSRLAGLEEKKKEFENTIIELSTKEKATARQRLATALSNTPKAMLDDRTDEGIKALREQLEATRRGLYNAQYDNDQLPEKVTIAGKEQSIRFKDAEKAIKFASWTTTKRTWNIGSQLLGDIDKYGWNEIFKASKVIAYAETQKWSIDENGELVKVKPSQKGSTPPADGYALIEAAIKSLEQRLNRKDVDLTSKQGDELADKAMLAITKAVASAKVAAQAKK